MSLITDTPPLLQPEGTYNFALNIINSTRDNASASISSEPGTTTIHTLPTNYEVIGQIYFSNKVLVFSTDNITSEIGVIIDRSYSRVYSGVLNFNKSNKILGEHRILRGCEDYFYFMDGVNPDRYINLDSIPTDPSLFSMLQSTIEPLLNVTINNTGGRMPSSGTSFLIQYTNLQGDVFESSEPTVSVPVYNDTISSEAQGSTNFTQKSATIEITNIDTRFPYIRLVAIHNEEGNYKVYQIDNLIPTNTEVIIEYQGPTDQDIELDNRDVQVNQAQYNTTLVSEQVQGRLLRANVQEIVNDYSGHQGLANLIVTTAVINQVPKSEFSQDPNNQHYTFQSDEVYALGIQYQDSTGALQPSPVYHIPGRQARPGELDTITFNNEEYLRYEIENGSQPVPDSTRSMGYYQTKTSYPDITLCDKVTKVYGALAGQPIRHHKMPSRRTIPLEQDNFLNYINLAFTNIIYPNGYDSHEIFYVARTDSNSTVLDSGYLHAHYDINEDFDNGEERLIHYFNSPRSFLEQNIKGQYFDISTRYRVVFSSFEQIEDVNGYDFIRLLKQTLEVNATVNHYNFYENNAYIQPKSTDSTTFYREILNFLNSRATNNYDISSQGPYTGGAGASPDRAVDYMFYSVNKRIISVNSNLQSLVYKPLVKKNNLYQGDTFISNFSFFEADAINGFFANDVADVEILNGTFISGKAVEGIYVESILNYNLLAGEHYLPSGNLNYVASKGDDGRSIVSQEEYILNQGYTYGSIKSYFPLPLTYDYCNRCRSKNPTRIIYSPQSFQEELSDSYLISNTNDYIDLPANTGPITGLKYKNGRLYVHTTQTTYVLTPNPQYLSTNELVAQLQTGDFLSIPPQEIIQTDYGYGGLQSKTGTINNEYGYFWIDGLRGSLNAITDGFRSISNNGMMNWFKNNTFESSQVTMAFDPFYHRLIATIRNNECQPYHTLSYSLNAQTFTCWHEYNPDFYLNNSTQFYSTYNNVIKVHEIDSNFLHPVIEQTTKQLITQNLISLKHYTEFYENDNEVIDSFSDLIVYNSNQSSGRLSLYIGGPYDSLFYIPDTRVVKITDKNHSISNIWDNSISSIVTEKACNSAYTDKNFINVRLEGEHYDKPIFKEKYTIARLSYRPRTDRRMTHYLLQQSKQQSIR